MNRRKLLAASAGLLAGFGGHASHQTRRGIKAIGVISSHLWPGTGYPRGTLEFSVDLVLSHPQLPQDVRLFAVSRRGNLSDLNIREVISDVKDDAIKEAQSSYGINLQRDEILIATPHFLYY